MNLFNLVARLSLDTGDFDSGVAAAKTKMNTFASSMESFGNKMESFGNTLAGWGTALTLGITTPIVTMGVKTAKTAIEFLKLKENTKVAFEVLLGSGEKAEKMLKDLYDFAQGTPLPYQSYLEAGKQLVAMGIAAEEVIPYLDKMTNAAIATGRGAAGLDTLATAIGRMSSRGKITLEELNRLIEMGVPAVKILGNAYGKTEAQIFDMMKQGELLTSVALPKLMNGMEKGTIGVNGMTASYGGLAAKMEGTLAGALDTVAARFRDMSTVLFDSEKAYPVLTNLVYNFSEAIKVVPRLLQGFTAAVTPALTKLNDKVKQFTDYISKADSTQLEKISKLILGLVAAGPVLLILGKFISVIGGITSAMGTIIPVITSVTAALGTFGGVMAALPIVGIVAALVILVTQFEGFRDTAAKVFSKVAEAGSSLWSVLSPVFNGLWSILQTIGTVILTSVLIAFNGLGEAIKWIADVMAPLQPAFEWFEKTMKNMSNTFMSLFSPMVDTTTEFGDAVSDSTESAINDYQELESKATTALNGLLWSGSAVTEQTKNDIIQKYKDLKDGVLKILEEQKNATISLVKKAFEGTAITEEDKKKTLDELNKYYEAQKISVEDGTKKINEILTNAAKENREITEEEQNEILAIQSNMQSKAVEALSKSKDEQLAIMEKLKADSGNITAATAAEAVKNSKAQYDGVVKAANDEYNDRMKVAAIIRDKLPPEYAYIADQLVSEAERQKSGVITQAEEMHKKVVDEAKLQSGDHVNEVNWETGEVKSLWNKLLEEAGTNMEILTTGQKGGWDIIKAAITGNHDDISKSWEAILNGMVEKGLLTNKDLEKMTSEQEQALLESWGRTDKNAKEKWESIKKEITDNASTSNTDASKSLDDLSRGASRSFEKVKTDADTYLKDSAKITNKSVSDMEDSFANASFDYPDLKTPHYSVSPWGWVLNNLLSGIIPSFSAKWYAKGGILERPTVFGVNPYDSSLMIGGEAGPEAIAPIDKLQDYVREAVSESNQNSALNNLLSILNLYLPEIAQRQVILSTGELVGALTPRIDNELGTTNALKARGNA